MVEPQNKTLGKKLKDFRMKKFENFGLRRVAEKIGLDYSYLYRIEEGLYTPSDETISKIAKSYDLSSEETLELFGLAHISPELRKALDKGGPDSMQSFAFYRKKKKNGN